MSGDSPNDGLSESAILIFQIFNGKIQIFNEIFWTLSFVKVVKGKNLRIDHTDKSPIHWKALKSREHGEKVVLPVDSHLEKKKKFGNCPIRKSRRVRAFYGSNSIFLTAISGQTGSQKTKWPMPNDSPTDGLSESAILIFQIFNG